MIRADQARPTRKKPSRVPPPDWRSLEYTSISETSAITRSSDATVVAWLHAGLIEGLKIGGKTLITVASLKRLLDGASPWTSKGQSRRRAI